MDKEELTGCAAGCDSCAGCGGPGGILQKLYPGEERNADPSDRPAAEKRGFPVMIEAEN